MFKKQIYEFKVSQDVEEHLDIVGGPNSDKLETCVNIIRSSWQSPDDYWIVEIKARNKDHNKYNIPSASIGGFVGTAGNRVGYSIIKGNTCEEAVESLKNIKITLYDWASEILGVKNLETTDGNMNVLYQLCDKFFARAYFSANKRSMLKTMEVEKEKGSKKYDFLNLATYGKGYNLITFIDCDIDPYSTSRVDKNKKGVDLIKNLLYLLNDNNITVLKYDLSHDGVHLYIPTREYHEKKKIIQQILDKDFNIRVKTIEGDKYEFSDNKLGDEPIKIKDNSSILIYSPCGKAPNDDIVYNTDFHLFPKERRYGTSNVSGEKYNPKRVNHNSENSIHTTMYNNLKNNFKKYKLTNSDIENMVFECVSGILNEIDSGFRKLIGCNGPLTEDVLLSPNDIFKDTIELYEKCKKSAKTKKDFLRLNIEEIFKNDPGYNIWKNYVNSMTGLENATEPLLDKNGKQIYDKDKNPIYRPKLDNVKYVKVRDENGNVVTDEHGKPKIEAYPKKAIGFFFWLENMTTAKSIDEFGGLPSKIMAFNVGDAYLFGYFNLGVFVANSFSGPKSSIFKLVKEICMYNNVIFSVSTDLGRMLLNLGLYTNGDIHPTNFGGRIVNKMTLTTNKDLLGMISKIDKTSQNKNKIDKKKEPDKEKPINVGLLVDIIKDKGIKNFVIKNPKILFSILQDENLNKKLNDNPEIINNILNKLFNGSKIQQQNGKQENTYNKKQ